MVKDEVQRIVKESPDMITALESIGAMYCIPSSHLLEDTTISSIKVSGDTIVTPSGVKPNTKSIVCAIGSVLDYISQRVDEKLNDFQNNNITKGQIEDHIKADANPSKGKVINRFVDPNGDEILVYDSGLVDMASTKEAIDMVTNLRKESKIPPITKSVTNASSYFTKDDDISVDEPRPDKFKDDMLTNLSSITHESADILDKIAHYHDTKHLGYEWLQEDGFDFVKPIDMLIQESGDNKKVKPSDIKHMKFDNTHILNAIKYFNQARDKQKEFGKGEWNIEQFLNTPEYNKGVTELEKQFDCKLAIYWFNDDQNYTDLYTSIPYESIKQKMYISKSKGFQLNGLPIEINVVNKAIDEEMTKEASSKLFGQFVCASLLHEIFHNVVSAVRYVNAEFSFTLNSALTLATSTPNAKNRRIVFSKFVNSLSSMGIKLNIFQKKKLVKDLCYISAVSYNKQALSEIKNKIDKVNTLDAADHEIDEYIKMSERLYATLSRQERKHDKIKQMNPVLRGILLSIAFGLTISVVGSVIGIPMFFILDDPMEDHEKYLNSTNKEEYYCDLFSSCYNLPFSFAYGMQHRDFSANQISKDKLNKLAMLEKDIERLTHSSYPSISERNYAAMICAKNILDSGEKIDPALKDYCEWVVANYSNILDTEIGEKHSTVTFDPNEANDLDQHLQNIITNNNIQVTESYIGRFRDVIIYEMSDATLDQEIDDITYLTKCYAKQIDMLKNPRVYQEGKLSDGWNKFKYDSKAPIKGYEDESIVKKILMFIPRVLNAIIQSIARIFNKNDIYSMMDDMRKLQKQVDELLKSDDKNKENIKILAKHILLLHHKINSNMNLEDERYGTIRKLINEMYADIQRMGVVKSNKSDQIEQMRTVLTLAGYVLYTFDLNAYSKLMKEIEDTLTKLDNLTVENVHDFTVFHTLNITNISNEIDTHKGHFVYSIDDFEKYTREIDTYNTTVIRHCNSLIKKFNDMNRKVKYGKNTDIKTNTLNNIKIFSERLSDMLTKLQNIKKLYTDDFNKIRKTINTYRNSITKLSNTNETTYAVLYNLFKNIDHVDNLNSKYIKEFYEKHKDPNKNCKMYICKIDEKHMQKMLINDNGEFFRKKVLDVDFDTLQNCVMLSVYSQGVEEENYTVYTTAIIYNKIDKSIVNMMGSDGDCIIET